MPSQQTEYPLDFKNVLLHTGNIIRDDFSLEYEQNNTISNRELLKAIDLTFSTLFKEKTSFYDQTSGLWKITDIPIKQDMPDQVEVTAKLFLLNTKFVHALDSLEHIQTQLGVEYIDTWIMSDHETAPTMSDWKQLELWVKTGKVRRLGVTDVDYPTLKNLVKNNDFKPSIDHVHVNDLDNHKELITFAKLNNIELLYNGDRTDILTEKELSLLMQRYNLLDNNAKVMPLWVLKYSVFLPFRQLVKDKGYIIMATRTEELE